LVFKARKRAFSAPRIWMVEAGHLAREVREPALAMRRAATVSPMSVPEGDKGGREGGREGG